jgi:hypothetical protein
MGDLPVGKSERLGLGEFFSVERWHLSADQPDPAAGGGPGVPGLGGGLHGFVWSQHRSGHRPGGRRFARMATRKFAAASIIKEESFDGNGAEVSASLYHLFNPGDLIPLKLYAARQAHYSEFMSRGRHRAGVCQLPEQPDHLQRAHRPALGWRRTHACSRRWPWKFPSGTRASFAPNHGPYGFYQRRQLRPLGESSPPTCFGPGPPSRTRCRRASKVSWPPAGGHQRGCRPFQRLPHRGISAARVGIPAVAAWAITTRKSAPSSLCCFNANYLCRWTLQNAGT